MEVYFINKYATNCFAYAKHAFPNCSYMCASAATPPCISPTCPEIQWYQKLVTKNTELDDFS